MPNQHFEHEFLSSTISRGSSVPFERKIFVSFLIIVLIITVSYTVSHYVVVILQKSGTLSSDFQTLLLEQIILLAISVPSIWFFSLRKLEKSISSENQVVQQQIALVLFCLSQLLPRPIARLVAQ